MNRYVPPPFRRGRLRHIGPKPPHTTAPQQKEAPIGVPSPGGKGSSYCFRLFRGAVEGRRFGPMWASAPTKRGRHRLVRRIGLPPAFLIRPSGPPSPRGKGSSYCFLLLGCGGGIGFGPMCLNRPLRNGGGTYLYRKSDHRPHSSSVTANAVPASPRGKLLRLRRYLNHRRRRYLNFAF